MSGKNLVLFIFSLLILFSAVSIKSQEGDSLYYRNPDLFLAKTLFNKKIVMLGDNGHHQPGVHQYVLSTLYSWLDLCKNKSEEENLTLIIEDDEPMSAEINYYIKTGDMQALVAKMNWGCYLEDLEYFADLRNFSRKIDSVNAKRGKKLSFKVKAFEQVGGNNVDRVLSLPEREQQLWFVNERDSVTAMGVINYINSNPNERILIFYGDAHLFNSKISKQMGGTDKLTPEESKGYFLAYYLDNEFGAENVIKFAVWSNITYQYAKRVDFPDMGNRRFIARPADLGIADSLALGADYIYHFPFRYLPITEGYRICSRLILKKNIECIKYVKPYRPSYVADMNYYRSLYNIFYLTGQYYFRNDSLLDTLIGENQFNTTDWLYSNRFDSVLSPLNYLLPQISGFFSGYGVDINNDSAMIHLTRLIKTLAPEMMGRAKFTNSIGIYWFGYPDEKIKAKEYLVKFSGEDFAEPEKYLQWYRMKYYGYKY